MDDYGISKDIDDDYVGAHDEPNTTEHARDAFSGGADETADADEGAHADEHDADKRQRIVRDAKAAGQPTDRAARAASASEAIFDRERGSAAADSIDEMIDEEAIIEHDGRASTRTFFRPSEASSNREDTFRSLIQWQEDKWSGMKNQQRAADRMRTVGNFSGQLDIGPATRSRIEHVEDGLNMSHMAHYSSDEVILAIVSLVANERGRMIRDENAYHDLVEAVGTDLDTIKRIRELVRRKSERL